jgi:hypothetical protein
MTIKEIMLAAGFVAVLVTAADAQRAQQRSRPEIEAEREQARFRAMDVDKDGVITRHEWRGNARAFDRFDINHDGVLSGAEIWIPGTVNQTGVERELLTLFHRADANNDGRLGRNEWWGDAATFARVDRDRDGVLTPAEFLGTEETVGTIGTDPQKQTRAYQAGHARGLIEGRQAGKEDKEGPNKWDLEGQRELEQADSGYTADLGLRTDYQAGYRAGFRLGYRQGFGPRR